MSVLPAEVVKIARATLADAKESNDFLVANPDEPGEETEPHEPCGQCTMARYIAGIADEREAGRARAAEVKERATQLLALCRHFEAAFLLIGNMRCDHITSVAEAVIAACGDE